MYFEKMTFTVNIHKMDANFYKQIIMIINNFELL